MAGLIYGLGIPHLSRHSVVLNATGKVLEEEQIKGVEFLSEIMPCGLEAYGVFVFTDQKEVPECLESLVGVLPEQLLAVRDPLVFLRVDGKVKGEQQQHQQLLMKKQLTHAAIVFRSLDARGQVGGVSNLAHQPRGVGDASHHHH